MTARFFADTNIAVYTLDADPEKRRPALRIMKARPVISVQVVNEFFIVALRKIRLPRETVGRLSEILMRRCDVCDLTAEVVRGAIDLGHRYQISHWDGGQGVRSCFVRSTAFGQ